MMQAKLNSIGIQIEGAALDAGNALPMLHEILHALRRFVERAEATTVDLRAIPFGPGDEDRLLSTLGEGEVHVTVEALGQTHLWETRFRGVWVVDYRDAEGERIGLQVEVTDIPTLIRTPGDDIKDAVQALELVLDRAE